MAKTNTIPITQTIKMCSCTLVNATGFSATNPGTAPTNTVQLTVAARSPSTATAGPEGSVLKSLVIASDDSSPRTIQVWTSTDAGTTKMLKGTVVVAALAGTATLVNVDFLGNSLITGLAFDETGKPVILLEANAGVYICVITAAVTASKTVWVTGSMEDF